MGKIKSMTMFIEEKPVDRESERFMCILELLKQLRDQSRLDGFVFNVKKINPEYAILKTRPKTKEEKRDIPKGDTVDFRIRMSNARINLLHDNYKLIPRKIDCYISIKYKNGNSEIIILDGIKAREG